MVNQNWDIILNGVGLSVISINKNALSITGQDRDIKGTFVPEELSETVVASRDVPAIFDNFDGGSGYSEKILENTYAWGKNVRTRDPGVVLPGPQINAVTMPAGTPSNYAKASAEFEGDLYFAAGDTLFKVSGGGSVVTVEWTNSPTNTISLGSNFGATCIQVFRPAGANAASMYVGGTGGRLWRKSAGVWTQAAAGGAGQPSMRFADIAPVYQVVDGVGSHRLVAADGSDQAQIWIVTADPMTPANWTNGGVIEGGWPVRKIAASNRHAYFVTDIGVFDLTEQNYSPNITPYWRTMQSSSNGRAALVYNGKVFATHYLGMDMVSISLNHREDTSEFAQPGVGTSNETPLFGPGTALTVDGGWLVGSQFNGTDGFVMYAKERSVLGIPGPGSLVWHGPEVWLDNEEITHMTVNGLQNGNPRLWIASIVRTTGGSGFGSSVLGAIKLYYCTIPSAATALQDYKNGGQHRFNTNYDMYLTAEPWGDKNKRKTIMRYDVQADNLANSRTIQILIKAEDETDFVDQGGAAGSPRATFYPPGEYKQAFRPNFLIRATGTNTDPPILRAFKVRAGIIEEQRKTQTYVVDLGHTATQSGGMDRRSVKQLRDFIFSLQTRGPVPMKDEVGDDVTVKIEAGVRFIRVNEPRTNKEQLLVQFDASFISQTPDPGISVTVESTPERYDNGYTYSDDSGVSTNPITWH